MAQILSFIQSPENQNGTGSLTAPVPFFSGQYTNEEIYYLIHSHI